MPKSQNEAASSGSFTIHTQQLKAIVTTLAATSHNHVWSLLRNSKFLVLDVLRPMRTCIIVKDLRNGSTHQWWPYRRRLSPRQSSMGATSPLWVILGDALTRCIASELGVRNLVADNPPKTICLQLFLEI
jgi:hypothetical protein